jgi:hypothetical protein
MGNACLYMADGVEVCTGRWDSLSTSSSSSHVCNSSSSCPSDGLSSSVWVEESDATFSSVVSSEDVFGRHVSSLVEQEASTVVSHALTEGKVV